MAGERRGERLGVAPGLGHAEAHMRAGRGGSIAHQRHAPEHQLRAREIVNRREERLHVGEAIEKLRRHDLLCLRAHLRDQILADERRRHRIVVLLPLLVDAHPLQLLRIADAVPDEIVTAMADPQVVVESGDGIADDLLPLRQEEGEVRKNARARRLREIGFLRRAAPDVITGIDRLHRGSDLLAYARTDAIAADEEIGALALAAGEVHQDAGAVLLHPLEGVAEVVVRLVDGRPHQPLQSVPGGEDLRQALFRGHATG